MVIRKRRLPAVLLALAMMVTVSAIPVAGEHDESYSDVTPGGAFAPAIQALEWAGILDGTECDNDNFCPDDVLTRDVMAVWLVRALDGADPAHEPLERFADVRADWPWAAHMERLADLGIAEQCAGDPSVFCLFAPVTRAEAATLLVKAFDLPEAADAGFGDLDGVENDDDINALGASGITAGCLADPLMYCPSERITRGQMAALIAAALRLAPRPRYEPVLLPVDPQIRFGALDNGFTYYLRSNDTPGNSMTLRLVVKAGSVNEPEPGRGIAHFLEHMVLRGTEAYPGEAFGSTVRSLGAELGPDTNAYVGFDQTVYELTVAADESEKVGTALHLLSQLAHAATIDPEVVVVERGVVIDEMRLRTATGSGQISTEFDRIYTEGTPYEGYRPIGAIQSLEAMTAEDLRDFYETWYVPSNMAIVAVGDMDVDEMQTLVEEHFAPMPAGEAPPFILEEVVPDPRPSYHVITHEEQGFTFISLDIPIPRSPAGTVHGERLGLMEKLIELMVLNRLEGAYYRDELIQVDSPIFVTFDHGNALRYYGTNWRGEELDKASAAYMSVLLTIEKYGFTDVDLARAAEQLTTSLEYELARAGTLDDTEYAEAYVTHFLFGADISATHDRHDRLVALLSDMKPGELTTRYRWLMNRAGPIFIAVGPSPSDLPTASELAAAVESVLPRSEPPPVEEQIETLMALPDPVAPVGSGPLEVLDGFEWEFANGARVVFVHSELSESTVEFRARSFGGWSQLEPGARALSPRVAEAVLGSGFGGLSKLQINRFLDESTASVRPLIGEATEGFDGASNTGDLETAFQMMHLLITAPSVDDRAFREALDGAAIRTALAEVRPDWQAWAAYNEARFGHEWHRPVATAEQLDSMSAESLLDLYRRRLGDVDDMLLSVVGDVDAEVVERLARHYIGTLPAGDADTYVDRRPTFPEGVTRREIPVGAEASAVLQISHEALVELTPAVRVNARVLGAVLDDRLVRQSREEVGASYIATVQIIPAFIPSNRVYSEIVVTAGGTHLDAIHARVLSILADLVASGPTTEELQQATAVVAADFEGVTNTSLLDMLTNRLYISDDSVLTEQRRLEELEAVTAATVQALATEIYDSEHRIEIVRVPAHSSEGSDY